MADQVSGQAVLDKLRAAAERAAAVRAAAKDAALSIYQPPTVPPAPPQGAQK